ncbi:hypothetical protein KC19_2G207400 [Ceratodon purpureus]|uniref:Galactose oxidase n=1 Tax=Ceratodon purpureus TaxID=3225 RepID=A0A8T0IXS3_CERPU|nr:hypothetical protein KC19_2G207400 [Ceratodon purpureus]
MNSRRWSSLVLVTLVLAALQSGLSGVEAAPLGTWRVVKQNAGISSMHTAVTPNVGSVVMLDHTNSGPSNLTFPDGRCRNTTYDRILKYDCNAHSIVMDPDSGVLRPLMVWTDTWCSSGLFVADGSLQQTGGDFEGAKVTRSLAPECFAVEPVAKYCDWQQNNITNSSAPLGLKWPRWYSTNVLLPDGRQILFGGKNSKDSNEFSPPLPKNQPARTMAFLTMTTDSATCNTTSNPYCAVAANGPNNWYPYAYLLPNDTIFLFANRDAIMYDYKKDVVVRKYPKIPGNPRNYPSGGSSAMLPLRWEDDYQSADVMVCGGATNTSSPYALGSASCGRMTMTDPAANWTMEDMPIPRIMGELVLLPDCTMLIINGAMAGYQGFKTATAPILTPVLYSPIKTLGQRFTVLNPSITPRVYHSTANLLTDGSVMVAGSNTHSYYTFKKPANVVSKVFFPTELKVEAFLPPYALVAAGGRPTITSVDRTVVQLGQILQVFFTDYASGPATADTFIFTMNSSPWSTHSYSQGQRMVTLKVIGDIAFQPGSVVNGLPQYTRQASLAIPKYSSVLPPTYYMLWVVKNGNPSIKCTWIRITK